MKSMSPGAFFARSISAGIAGGLIAATADLLLNLPGRGISSLPVTLGILLPLGATVGFFAAAGWKIFVGNEDLDLSSAVLHPSEPPGRSVRILVYGLTALFGAKLLYTAAYFFAVGFHHPGLAAFALLLVLSAAAVFGGVLLPFACRLLETTVVRIRLGAWLLSRPIAPICFVAGATLGILLPPLLIGPDARGPFGFIGQFALDGTATALLLLLPITTVALTLWSRTIPFRRLLPIFAALTLLTAFAPHGALRVLRQSPTLRASIEAGQGPSAAILRFTKRAFEK